MATATTTTATNNNKNTTLLLCNPKSQWIIVATLVCIFMVLLSFNQKNSMSGMIDFTNNTWQQQRSTQVIMDGTTKATTTTTIGSHHTFNSQDEDEDNDDHDEEVSILPTKHDNMSTNNSNKKTESKVQQITILGERNSGTRWTYDHVKECFRPAIVVSKRLTRYKHWFQHDNSSAYLHDTLVLAQFRNPYEWLKAMEHVPHHSPAHLRTTIVRDPKTLLEKPDANNDWKIFLTKPWTMPRVGLDLQLDENATCQDFFRYKDIVSCVREPLPASYYNWTMRYSEHQPFYEMRNDGSGLPYNNIMELRTDKIRNLVHDVRRFDGVRDVILLQYEYLLMTGTKPLLDRIEKITGIKPNCRPIEPQNRQPRDSRLVSPEFATYVRHNLNWTVEAMIGYYPELEREQVE